MTSVDPTSGVKGDSLKERYKDTKMFSTETMIDFLYRVYQLMLHQETHEAALHAISAWMALLSGNMDQANREQARYKKIAHLAGRPADETIPAPILTTKKDVTL